MLFFDQLVVDDWYPLFNMRDGKETKAREMPMVQDAVVFEITNCADYRTAHPSTEPIVGRRIAVPDDIEVAWFEFKEKLAVPDDAIGAVQHAMTSGTYTSFGHVVKIIDLEGEEARNDDFVNPSPGSKWWIIFMDFMRKKVGGMARILGPSFNCQLVVGHHGDVQHVSMGPYFNRARWKMPHPDMSPKQKVGASRICEPALFAMQMLEDSGCEVYDPTQTGPSRTYRRQHGRDLCIYNKVSVPT
jgi:hypothetical protein